MSACNHMNNPTTTEPTLYSHCKNARNSSKEQLERNTLYGATHLCFKLEGETAPPTLAQTCPPTPMRFSAHRG